jgi:hypothetical protein
MILTTLSDYAKQKGISRARAYQLQSKLPTIDLPVYAIADNGDKIPLYKDNQPVTQTYVQQDKGMLQAELDSLRAKYNACATRDVYRLGNMIRAIETILK